MESLVKPKQKWIVAQVMMSGVESWPPRLLGPCLVGSSQKWPRLWTGALGPGQLWGFGADALATT